MRMNYENYDKRNYTPLSNRILCEICKGRKIVLSGTKSKPAYLKKLTEQDKLIDEGQTPPWLEGKESNKSH